MNKNNPAEQLRKIRKSKGWSLQDVERHSNGKWKAVVVGSYERSDRAISLKKAIALLDFYQVPITELFPEYSAKAPTKVISLDIVKINSSSGVKAETLQKFVKVMSNRRRDWNGRILTVRDSDLPFVSLLLDLNPIVALEYLKEAQFLSA
jgi:transcriptional regulator with XRE-family HTH domain